MTVANRYFANVCLRYLGLSYDVYVGEEKVIFGFHYVESESAHKSGIIWNKNSQDLAESLKKSGIKLGACLFLIAFIRRFFGLGILSCRLSPMKDWYVNAINCSWSLTHE
ncbi:hypothetical protein PV326_012066 [Microctonus aethiopoides]|nr:hypothetical protein PV326_012066 [Microctonus aethiopoides]